MSYADASKRRKLLAEQQAVAATSDSNDSIDSNSTDNDTTSSDSSDSDTDS